jgi:hypothetical protein
MGKIEPRLPQSRLYFPPGRQRVLVVHDAPEHGAIAVYMHPGGYLNDTKPRIQSRHQVLDGLALVFVPHRECFGQSDLDLHAASLFDDDLMVVDCVPPSPLIPYQNWEVPGYESRLLA